MPTIDEQFVEYIVKSLVGNPEAVKINRTIDEKGVLLELTVDPEDLGRVIGKRGSTAQSLRTLLRALGTKNDARYNLKIVDVDGGNGRTRTPADDSSIKDQDDAQDDNITTSDEPGDESVEESTDEIVEEPSKSETLAEKTRKELADLDDLDL